MTALNHQRIRTATPRLAIVADTHAAWDAEEAALPTLEERHARLTAAKAALAAKGPSLHDRVLAEVDRRLPALPMPNFCTTQPVSKAEVNSDWQWMDRVRERKALYRELRATAPNEIEAARDLERGERS